MVKKGFTFSTGFWEKFEKLLSIMRAKKGRHVTQTELIIDSVEEKLEREVKVLGDQ